jgi:hypothetical protein
VRKCRSETEPDAWSSELWSEVSDPALAVLVSYQRAELSTLQERLVRADSKAAGVVSATIAVAAIGATGLASLPHDLTTIDAVLVGLAALFLILALIGAVQIRDTAEKHNWFGRFVVWLVPPSRNLIASLLEWRAAVSRSEPEPPPDGRESSLQRAISQSLMKRINAAALLQGRMNRQAQLATLGLTAGIALLTLSAVLIINGV